MAKVNLKSPIKRYTHKDGRVVKCPRCGYDCHRITGVSNTEVGIDPENIEFECGRCEAPFYLFFNQT